MVLESQFFAMVEQRRPFQGMCKGPTVELCSHLVNLCLARMWASALLDIGGALCSKPQSLADAHYYNAVQ